MTSGLCCAGRPGCIDGADPALAAVLAAVAAGDIDAALDAGLLQVEADARPQAACPGCQAAFAAMLAVRDERRHALAARGRYRARMERLLRRREARDAARSIPPGTPRPIGATTLPPAAAAALARALARAASTS